MTRESVRNATRIRNGIVVIGLLSCPWISGEAHAQSGVPDRHAIVQYLRGSAMQLRDMNGDCGISDMDVSMMIHDRLMQQYGAALAVEDLNGNGQSDGEDMMLAIIATIKSAYGKVAPADAPVDWTDVAALCEKIDQQDPSADVNFDDAKNGLDLLAVFENFDGTFFQSELNQVAGSVFEYIGLFVEQGRDAFMATHCAEQTHQSGTSNTWPERHPKWWKPNHVTSVSDSFNEPEPPGHLYQDSRREPYPRAHSATVSERWPANHARVASSTWPPPTQRPAPEHSTTASQIEPPPPLPPMHRTSHSANWPAGHGWAASETWTPTHAVQASRTWWPEHLRGDSSGSSPVIPPMHATHVTDTWGHTVAGSETPRWPPNHGVRISECWGPMHQGALSVSYPPNHAVDASNSWPGPRPSWPPSHVRSASESWEEPTPGSGPSTWPAFPPNHNWFSTFRDVVNPVIPRFPFRPRPPGPPPP